MTYELAIRNRLTDAERFVSSVDLADLWAEVRHLEPGYAW